MDFSKSAMHALEYAIKIANRVEANVLMIWVDKPESEDSLYQNPTRDHRLEAKRRFDDIIKQYGKTLKKGCLAYKLRKGKVYKEIANQAKYNDAYLVLAGAHGVSGFETFWIGSNAYKIVSYAPCPVITLRDTFKIGKDIKKIVLPIDNSSSTRQKVPFAIEFASLFCSEVHVLELQSSILTSIRKKVSSYAAQVLKYLQDNKVKHVHQSVNADNITSATISYAEKIGADLIIIMTEQEEETANIFLGPYAQQMVNNSPVPVMSVHPKKLTFVER
jgi:nucleotide-binding universal stress UspA family protein